MVNNWELPYLVSCHPYVSWTSLLVVFKAMDVIQESNFRLKLSHKSKSNQDEIIHMKRDQSVRGQTEKFISETQKLFTHPKR